MKNLAQLYFLSSLDQILTYIATVLKINEDAWNVSDCKLSNLVSVEYITNDFAQKQVPMFPFNGSSLYITTLLVK